MNWAVESCCSPAAAEVVGEVPGSVEVGVLAEDGGIAGAGKIRDWPRDRAGAVAAALWAWASFRSRRRNRP